MNLALLFMSMICTSFSWCYLNKFSINSEPWDVDFAPDNSTIVVAEDSNKV